MIIVENIICYYCEIGAMSFFKRKKTKQTMGTRNFRSQFGFLLKLKKGLPKEF